MMMRQMFTKSATSGNISLMDLQTGCCAFWKTMMRCVLLQISLQRTAWLAVPAMITLSTLSNGPVMIYSGQEVGEQAEGTTGFSSSDGRTSIFDYCAVPQLQKWNNGGMFDGAKLSDSKKNLRSFLSKAVGYYRWCFLPLRW